MEREGTDPRPVSDPVSLSDAGGTALLAKLAHMPEVKGLRFNGKTVVLDGYRFVGCRFDNCTLVVNSVHFELKNCFIDHTNTIMWQGDLVKAIQLFSFANPGFDGRVPGLAPVRNEDGTITVAG